MNFFDTLRQAHIAIGSKGVCSTVTIAGSIPPELNGWARLSFPSGADVTAQSEVVFFPETMPDPYIPAFSSENMAVRPNTQFAISVVHRTERRVGIGIVNPSPTVSAKVELAVKPPAGFGLSHCPATFTLGPLQRASRFLDEFCGPVTDSSLPPGEILITVKADNPIAVGATDVFRNGNFSGIPVHVIP